MLHIELRKWADLLLIAPLSANSLAKIANGMADNLLTSVVRAWDYKKPLLVWYGMVWCVMVCYGMVWYGVVFCRVVCFGIWDFRLHINL